VLRQIADAGVQPEGHGRWALVRFSDRASYRALLSGCVVGMVPPEGFARLAQLPIDLTIAA
jgi:hypothetical protein